MGRPDSDPVLEAGRRMDVQHPVLEKLRSYYRGTG